MLYCILRTSFQLNNLAIQESLVYEHAYLGQQLGNLGVIEELMP